LEDGSPDYTTGIFTNVLDGNGDPIPHIIISGTGRFANATGELFHKNGTFGPGGSTWDIIGEIIY
jgi:hypothetical protein